MRIVEQVITSLGLNASFVDARAAVLSISTQITASAVCVALYVTRFGKNKAATRLASLKKTKSLCTNPELGVKLPHSLLQRLDTAILELTEEDKKEMKEASRPKKGGLGKRRREASA